MCSLSIARLHTATKFTPKSEICHFGLVEVLHMKVEANLTMEAIIKVLISLNVSRIAGLVVLFGYECLLRRREVETARQRYIRNKMRRRQRMIRDQMNQPNSTLWYLPDAS